MIHTVSTIDPNVLMREKLERLICEKTAGAIRGLRVDCRDNQILLTGQTSRYYNKQLATQAVREVLQDDHLMNQIDVV